MIADLFCKISVFISDPRAFVALLSWPRFSLTSYTMISQMHRQGIRPATVLDVGANTGQFAIASNNFFPDSEIHCFEPLPKCVAQLRRFANNNSKINVHAVALGDQAGQIEFHVNSHAHSSSVLPLADHHRNAFPQARDVQTISVPISTLDLVAENMVFPSPVLLKLDAQGYEAAILRGAQQTLKRVDFVILECSFRRMYEGEVLFAEILRMMEGLGFSFLRPVGWLKDPRNGEILQADALFVRATSESMSHSR